MKFKIFISLLFLIFTVSLFSAQDNKPDSLLKLLSDPAQKKATVLNDIADFYSLTNPDTSLYYAQMALVYAVNTENSIEKCRAYNRTAMYYSNRGEQKTVMYYLLKALDNAAQANDSTQYMKVYNNLGVLYYDMIMYDSAIANLKKSITYVPKKDASKMYGNMYNNLGMVYHEKGEYDVSLSFYEKALELYNQESDKRGIGIANGNLGRTYFALGKNSSALTHLYICASTLAEEKDYANLALTYMNIAEVYESSNDFENAASCLNKSLEIAEENNYPEVSLRVFRMCAEIYEDAGQYKEALYYQKLFKTYNDSLLSAELKQEVSAMKIKYESEKKNQQIILLNKENEISQERSRTRGNWLFALVVSIVVVAAFMIFFLYQKIMLSRSNKELVRKNIEIAFSENTVVANPKPGPVPAKVQIESTKDEDDFDEIEAEDEEINESKYPYSKLTDDQKKELAELLIQTMKVEKPYLDGDFTINKLAIQLDKSRTYISQVVNEYFNKNFKNFINEFRVREACRLLVTKKNLTIEAIAKEVGFKSKSSFNTAFKYYTGLTPTTFIKHTIDKDISDPKSDSELKEENI